ncbi:hypothetical protein GCM10009839_09970 [Catenulispora yoronensis]|uniref:NB-ARC domain-containing protein n=1 Tax=Catenulispora yoronensis TaxID=450799 RepID=A0ABN2TP92_9ACTN
MTLGTEIPDPDKAGDLAEFIEALGRLRLWAGGPTYRTLAKRVGPLLPVPQEVALSTVADVFHPQRRRLDLDLVVAIVRALGLPDPTVNQWRQACLRVHRVSKTGGPGGVSRQLPATLPTFTGRVEALKALLTATAPKAAVIAGTAAGTAAGSVGSVGPVASVGSGTPAPTVVITAVEGMAGVGKTQLAVHAANELVKAGHFTDTQLYVNLRGFDPDQPPVDPYEVLGGFLRAIGVPAPQVPAAHDDRAAMFRDRMHDRQALVLLDNAADEDQVRDLIPASPTSAVLITSRRSLVGLDSATVHRLDVFTHDEAMTLLRRIAGRQRIDAEPEAATELLALCGQLPLAVVLTASRLRARPSWTIAQLVERLRGRLLDAANGGGRDLRAVFDLSYQSLAHTPRRLFRLLGLNPGADITAEAAAALAGTTTAEAGEILEALLDEHLIEQRTFGRYEFHDLLRDYARQAAVDQEPAAERDAAIDRLMRYQTHTTATAMQILTGRPNEVTPDGTTPVPPPAMPTAEQARAWLDAERANLLATSELATTGGWHTHGWQLPAIIGTYLHLQLDNAAWVTVNERAVTSAGRLNNRRAMAISTKNHAAALIYSADFTSAQPVLNTALHLMRELGDLDGQAGLHNNMAMIDCLAGRFTVAIDHYQRCLDLCRELGYTTRMSTPLGNIAISLCWLDRAAEALPYAEESLSLVEQSADRKGECYALSAVANSHLGMGNHSTALAYFDKALASSRSVGNRGNEMLCIDGLARTHARQGTFDDAYRFHNEALAMADSIGNSPDLARLLNNLADTKRRQGRREDAHATFKQALEASWSEFERARAEQGIADTAR